MDKISQYKEFCTILNRLIIAKATLDNVAELVFANRYCNGLCTGVSRKFNVPKEDLMAELVFKILDKSLLDAVLKQHCAFNGRVFTYQVMNVARFLQRKEKLYDTRDFNFEWVAAGGDLESDVIGKLSESKLDESIEMIKAKKLQELQMLYSDIGTKKTNIKNFCQSIELNIYQLMVHLKINNRYKLLKHPECYTVELKTILGEYIELFNKWFLQMDLYVQELVNKHNSWLELYNKLKPRLSYATFVRNYSSPTIWDMPELELMVESLNV